jgi:hypothetical protein
LARQYNRVQPCPPSISAATRTQWFRQCLAAIGALDPPLPSIDFPCEIGCGLAGGVWPACDVIVEFATAHPETHVIIARRNAGASNSQSMSASASVAASAAAAAAAAVAMLWHDVRRLLHCAHRRLLLISSALMHHLARIFHSPRLYNWSLVGCYSKGWGGRNGDRRRPTGKGSAVFGQVKLSMPCGGSIAGRVDRLTGGSCPVMVNEVEPI